MSDLNDSDVCKMHDWRNKNLMMHSNILDPISPSIQDGLYSSLVVIDTTNAIRIDVCF